MRVFIDSKDKEHIAYVFLGHQADQTKKTPLVRIHSECITGEVFDSTRCDCKWQLQSAMDRIAAHGYGAIVYLRQEGRGIGLNNKLAAYNLQDKGLDTVEANLKLGFGADDRSFELSAEILKAIDMNAIDLLTNNPNKAAAMPALGVQVLNTIAIIQPQAERTPQTEEYLKTKVEKMGHASKLLDKKS